MRFNNLSCFANEILVTRKFDRKISFVLIDEEAWSALTNGWLEPTIINEKNVEGLKKIDQWIYAEKKVSKFNSLAISIIIFAVDADQFNFIKRC